MAKAETPSACWESDHTSTVSSMRGQRGNREVGHRKSRQLGGGIADRLGSHAHVMARGMHGVNEVAGNNK